MPSPPPTAVSAAAVPIAALTFSRGNSSRMIPNASGMMPPPMPWITRAAIMTPIDVATAASSDPIPSATRVTSSIRSLPTMSPIRPRMGVATDADSRYAVITQVTVLCVVCRWCWTVGSTGATSDCSRA